MFKQRKLLFAGVIRLKVLSPVRAQFCFLRRLHQFQLDCVRIGVSLHPYLLRPEATDRLGFKSEPLSSCGLNKRFQKHLKDLDMFAGESLHGIRRSAMQHSFGNGSSLADIGSQALQITPSVTAAYLDTSRETGGPVRQKRRRG